MQASDPVRMARALFEAYRRGEEAAMLHLAHVDVHDEADVEITPHSFELIPPEHVLVSGRLRVFRRGLRDSPAWWLLTMREGVWVAGTSHPSEAAARAALPALA